MFEANQIQITSGTKVNNVIVVSLAEDIEDVRKPILGVSVGVLSKVLMVDEIPVLLAAIKDVKAGLRSTHRASWEDISTKLDSIEKSYTKFQNDTSSIEDDRRLVENIALRAATATELIFTISHLRHFSRMISVWSDTKPVDSSQWSGDPNNAMNAALFAICQDLIVDLKSAREKYLGERTAFDKYVKEQFPDLDFTRIENQSWDVR
jgi:hypothetical protein